MGERCETSGGDVCRLRFLNNIYSTYTLLWNSDSPLPSTKDNASERSSVVRRIWISVENVLDIKGGSNCRW